MSKNISAPLLRTARLLDLVPYLHTHQGIALKELAKHFEVSQAQMSADLTTLWMCGLPGYTPLELMDLEFESGFVSIRNAATLSKPRSITFQEGVALLLGLDLVASSLPDHRKDLLTAIDSLKMQLTQVLGVPIILSAVPSSSGTVALSIANAIHANGGLVIKYHSMYKDQVTVRDVIPYELVTIDKHQYLRGYCCTAQDSREFRVDRILEAQPIDIEPVVESRNRENTKVSFSITVMHSSRDMTERFAVSNVHVGETIELSSYSRQWIERSVMASGRAVSLISPLDIRAEVAQSAQLLLDRYKAE